MFKNWFRLRSVGCVRVLRLVWVWCACVGGGEGGGCVCGGGVEGAYLHTDSAVVGEELLFHLCIDLRGGGKRRERRED